MEYQDCGELIRKLSLHNKVEATKELTKYYAEARFGIKTEAFSRQYTDGGNDGGIDFHHSEDTSFFIFQTKFSGDPKKVGASEIFSELKKLKNTLTSENPNKKADGFVNSFRRETGNKEALLEIFWLTTNIVEQSVRDKVQADVESWRKKNRMAISDRFHCYRQACFRECDLRCKTWLHPTYWKKNIKIRRTVHSRILGRNGRIFCCLYSKC